MRMLGRSIKPSRITPWAPYSVRIASPPGDRLEQAEPASHSGVTPPVAFREWKVTSILCRLFVAREVDAKGGACAGFALDPDVAAAILDDPVHGGQAQPRAR